MPKAIATGISHKSLLKILVSFPFSRVVFLDISCSAFAGNARGFWNSVNLSHDESASNLGTGGTTWVGQLDRTHNSESRWWKFSRRSSFLESLELKTCNRSFDWKERKRRKRVKAPLFSILKVHQKAWENTNTNLIQVPFDLYLDDSCFPKERLKVSLLPLITPADWTLTVDTGRVFVWVFAMGKKRSDSEKPQVLAVTSFCMTSIIGEWRKERNKQKSEYIFLRFQEYPGWWNDCEIYTFTLILCHLGIPLDSSIEQTCLQMFAACWNCICYDHEKPFVQVYCIQIVCLDRYVLYSVLLSSEQMFIYSVWITGWVHLS